MEYEPGQEVVPGYTLVGRLGSGMAGQVWIAQAAGGIHVAVKIIHNLSLIGGRKELGALKTIRNVKHPNLCPIFGFWTKDATGRILEEGETESITVDSMSSVYSVAGGPHDTDSQSMDATMAVGPMPAARDIRRTDGDRAKAEQLIVVMGLGERTLSDRLAEVRLEAGAGPKDAAGLQPAEIIRYLHAAASAIDLLNTKHKIYHCDIKPQNILIVGGDAQVCDFGIANRIEGDVKKTSHAIATPAYGAPEVLQDQTYSSTVDQYSLAVTYYELRTGLLPFQATTAAGIAVAKATERLDLAKISAAERKVLQRALRVDPKARYSSCEELVHQLAIATGVERHSNLSLTRLALIAAAVALLAAGSLVAWQQAAPQHFQRTFASLSGGEAVTAILDRAEQKVAEAEQADSLGVTHERVRFALEDLGKARSIANRTEATRADELGARASLALLRDWNQTLDDLARGADAPKRLEQMSDAIETLNRGLADGVLLEATDERAERLRAALDLASLRLALEGGPGADALADRAESVRQRLIHNNDSFESSWTDADTASVAVALSWLPHRDADLQNETAVDDVKRAAAVDTPNVYASRWSELHNRALQAMRAALHSPSTDPALRDHISRSFPTLAVDAALADLKASMEQGKWDEVPTQLKKAQQLALGDLSGRAQQQIDLLSGLVAAVEQPEQTLTAMTRLGNMSPQVLQSRSLTAPELRKLVDAWLTKLGQGWTESPASPETLQLAADARQAVLQLPEPIRVEPPAPLNAAVVALAVGLGAEAVAQDSVIKAAEALQADAAYGQLAAAARIEALAFKTSAAPSGELRKLNAALANAEPTASFPSVPAGYLMFAQGLGLHLASNAKQAKSVWATLGENEAQLTALGQPRRTLVAERLLRHLIDDSGVPDSDVVNLRYADDPESAKTDLLRIQRWLGPAALSNTTFVEQSLLASVASDPGRVLSGAFGAAVAALEPAKLSGQSNRGLFERLRRSVSPAGAERLEDVNRLVQATAAMLKADPEQQTEFNPAFFVQVLEPAMSIVGRTSRAEGGAYLSTAADGVTRVVQPGLDRSAVHLVCLAFANQASNDFSSKATTDYQSHISNWYRDREIAAATAAALEQDPSERQRLLLLAADSYREYQNAEARSFTDPRAIETLQVYIQRASAVPGRPPQLPLLQAHLAQFRADVADSLAKRLKYYDEAIQTLEPLLRNPEDQDYFCEALIQHSAALLKWAFHGPQAERKPKLLRAVESAEQAAAIAEKDPNLRQLLADDAYMALGNAHEDLAMYCYTAAADEALRRESFNEAVAAFEQAINVQGLLVDSEFNARVALGRCLYRYWRAERREELLTEAERAFGEPDPNAALSWRGDWYIFRSQVAVARGKTDEAIEYATTLVDLLKHGSGDSSRYNVALLALSDALVSEGSAASMKQALEVLKDVRDPNPLEFWRLVNQKASLLYISVSEEPNALMEFATWAIDEAAKDPDAVSVRQEEASEALAYLMSYISAVTDGWSLDPKPLFTRSQVIPLMDRALPLLPTDGSKLAQAHRGIIQTQRMVLEDGSTAASMLVLLNALDLIEKEASHNPDMLEGYRRLAVTAVSLAGVANLLQGRDDLTLKLPTKDKQRLHRHLRELAVTAAKHDPPFARQVTILSEKLKELWKLN